MKTSTYPILLALIITFLAVSCSEQIDDPVFDYNLKSAKVIETNNNFGIDQYTHQHIFPKLYLVKLLFQED